MPREEPHALLVNWGYARAAIHELFSKVPVASREKKGKETTSQNSEKLPCTSEASNQSGEGSELQSTHNKCTGLQKDDVEPAVGVSKTNASIKSNSLPNENARDPVQHFVEIFGLVRGLPESSFKKNSPYPSDFERYVKSVLTAFAKKWHPIEDRQKYLDNFL